MYAGSRVSGSGSAGQGEKLLVVVTDGNGVVICCGGYWLCDGQMFQKLSQNFQQALNAYKEVSEGIEHKQQGAIDRSSRSGSAASGAGGKKPKRGVPNRKESDASDDLESGRRTGGGTADEALLSPSAQAQAQAQEEDIQFTPYNIEELETRRQDIAALERDVLDVADMFKDLALMVDQQQEGIDTIADNISDAKQKAEEGAGQLDQAEDYQKSARKKKCCLIFLILVVLGLVVLGIVVLGK